MQGYYQSYQQLNFIRTSGQQKLSTAKVLVIGAGGLWGYNNHLALFQPSSSPKV